MSEKDVAAYLNGPFKSIEGWCIPHIWQVIQPLARLMQSGGQLDPVAEIGVHHGKFFFGLVKTAGAGKDNYAIDVFDLQKFNLDRSGKGNLSVFKSNMERVGIQSSAVQAWQTDSLAIDERAIRKLQSTVEGFSFFSVDGCHLPEHTANDIMLATRVTKPYGIIFVDDYYNANWPGVQEGVARLFLTQTPKFVPLLFSCNKLFLAHISYHAEYLQAVEEFVQANFPETKMKRVRRFGYEGLTIVPRFDSNVYLQV